MMKISDAQIKAAANVASDVFDKKLTAKKGAELLALSYGININSARDFINDYKYMMQGRLFHHAMSASGIDHFLKEIQEKREAKFHSLSVSSVEQHILYYENLRNVRLHRMRAVLETYKGVTRELQLSDHLDSFRDAVRDSLRDSALARKNRLKKSTKSLVRLVFPHMHSFAILML